MLIIINNKVELVVVVVVVVVKQVGIQSEKFVQEKCRCMSSDFEVWRPFVLYTLINRNYTPYLPVMQMIEVIFRSCFLFAEANHIYGA
jgi:hypothetical protein